MNSPDRLLRWLRKLLLLSVALFAWHSMAWANAENNTTEWPQELKIDEGTIVVYQPQPEGLQGKTLTGRAAMSMELKNTKDPVYGVFWFTADIETERSNDSAIITNIKVSKVGWPDSKDAGEQRFSKAVEDTLENSSFNVTLSKLTASLTTSQKVKKSLEGIKNDAPAIVFSEKLAVLLMFDGKPAFKAIENSPYERAINTPLAVAKDGKNNTFYLFSGSTWYSASDALGPWTQTQKVPTDLVALMPKTKDSVPIKVPVIVTASKPTELVVSDGEPNWISLSGGQLLYVKNTETPWLRDISSGNMYLLLSGRWYRAKDLSSKWVFVRADELPASFQNVPPGSDIAGIRTSIAGTDEANHAVIDTQIPQTAAIKRSEATLTVSYDGSPKFEQIKGSEVSYAVNTSAQVLLIDNIYYAVDNAVWFTAPIPTGPWVIADKIPANKIAEIPPSSPMYNTTFVTIYDSTPEVVYVGYTPGYMWSYPYYGVPIYGTGWYYPPYWGVYYYPRPPTWGLHVGYNPRTGWNFGVSWGSPYFSVGVTWGGGGYRCCGGGWYGGGYHHNTNINVNGDINIGNSVSVGNHDNVGRSNHNNLYKSPENRHRNAEPSARQHQQQEARSNTQRRNDVFADNNGNVVRQNNDQWQQRTDNQWKDMPNTDKQQLQQHQQNLSQTKSNFQPKQGANFDHQQMNRVSRARGMGGNQRVARRGGGGGRGHR